MEFHCSACDKAFRCSPNPVEVPFEVEGFEGLHLSGFKVRAVDGKLNIKAAACPACGRLAPRTCTAKPASGESLAGPCPECGHAAVLHVGVEHCPVCELVQHNQQVREAIVDSRVFVDVRGLDERSLELAVERVLVNGMRRPYRR